MQKIKASEIVYREDLYPRFEPNQATIQKYAYSVEYLPPIKLNQSNILIDGFHRWKAHQLAGETEIAFEVIETASEKELKKLAYQLNANHGLQLSSDEKRVYAREMVGDMSIKELAIILSTSESIITKWTVDKREALKEERNRMIVELYLRAWNTQQSITDVMGVPQKTISDIINNSENSKITEIAKAFTPPIYNIWNLKKQDNATESHFGSFPLYFMKSLLHYHSDPLHIIFDPFAGGGTTVDACKEMFRRYYCTDREVKPGREKDIQQHDILTGFPDMTKPDMLFLDPPYWVLAKDEYSEDETDLGNMTKEQFFDAMRKITDEAKSRKVNRIAYVIRPIWETGQEKWQWIDPMFELYDSIKDKYEIEARYVLPYSSEQYSGLWVNRAKDKNQCLILNRELTVFKLK
jgi:hypothetical protein